MTRKERTATSPLMQTMSSLLLAVATLVVLSSISVNAFQVTNIPRGSASRLHALNDQNNHDLLKNDETEHESTLTKRSLSRREIIPCLLALSSLPSIPYASAEEEETSTFVRQGKNYAYEFIPPSGFKEGNKPLKTHLDEVNFAKEGAPRGYQYGVTVDPVRIDSLRQFGTPEEVAARVVTAEVNRDGIFEVTLVKDPVENPNNGSYEIDYLSDGKRGKKNFVTRIFISKNMLYVLTAQAKEENYKELEQEILDCVKTFSVTAN